MLRDPRALPPLASLPLFDGPKDPAGAPYTDPSQAGTAEASAAHLPAPYGNGDLGFGGLPSPRALADQPAPSRPYKNLRKGR